MADDFKYDVFLSHSTKEKAIIRAVAERLRGDGLRVWLDEWEIRPGDSIPAKIEAGLEHSRVLVLCMSAHAFGSDPGAPGLEAGTFFLSRPTEPGSPLHSPAARRGPIKGSVAQFLCIDWRGRTRAGVSESRRAGTGAR